MAIRQGRGERRPSMRISYAPLDGIAAGAHVVCGQHHLLAGPAHMGAPQRCEMQDIVRERAKRC